jgi:SAM-dependent methyltransferase
MTPKTEWWETFFHGPWGEWQARGFMQQDTSAQVDFIVKALGIEAGDQVLDVACGTGRHAIELAKRGIEVTGIDFNGTILEVAERKAAEQLVEVLFLRNDMRCLKFREEFDAAYSFWTSFGYFEDESHDYVVLRRIAESLRPGGKFLLELLSAETLLPIFQPERTSALDESGRNQLRNRDRLDLETGRVESEWTFVEDGRERKSRASLRLYNYRELCTLLQEAGFENIEGYDSKTGEPFGVGAKRLALVATNCDPSR